MGPVFTPLRKHWDPTGRGGRETSKSAEEQSQPAVTAEVFQGLPRSLKTGPRAATERETGLTFTFRKHWGALIKPRAGRTRSVYWDCIRPW